MDVERTDEKTIEQLSTRVVYETPYMRLRDDKVKGPDGSEGIYSYVEKPDFALIIAVEDGGFHLIQQYRYPVRSRSWEFPQGTFPDMATGPPEQLAWQTRDSMCTWQPSATCERTSHPPTLCTAKMGPP